MFLGDGYQDYAYASPEKVSIEKLAPFDSAFFLAHSMARETTLTLSTSIL